MRDVTPATIMDRDFEEVNEDEVSRVGTSATVSSEKSNG